MAEDIVVCEPLRSAVGAYGGQFKNIAPEVLGTQVVRELLDRTGISPDVVDDVIFGQCYPQMEAPAIGRVIALDAGMPVTVPGRQVDRRCGSGLQAVIDGMAEIVTGGAEVVISGGAETMSRAAFFNENIRWGIRGGNVELKDSLTRGRLTAGGKNYPVPGGMIETAENLRRDYSISREAQDELAVESHRRATAATQDGRFAEEIVPIVIPATRKQPEQHITLDEHIRPDANLESLSKLKPIMGKQDDAATVTAGNASGQNDGAAACIVTTRSKAEALGLKAYARIVSWGVAGVAPNVMGIGPVPAVEKALAKADLSLKDIDLIELNEAFAAQALACTREWDFGHKDFERMNVNGSGISLGHPVGATGVRILTTLLREMDRRGARYGLETMCIGGGQGLAAIFERIED
ncbi:MULTISPECIES: acetyl-CoA C-acetyltransferase [Brevibacterium]|uniref:Acetyl-CoA C-acetyltransferase n=1 Tax=Brevibacterium gallinarum TaxID=2762220 RepID=A0ABR8WXA0_9MICO|nr:MULTISPECIES: acetyl-CoA C-acetyltransferase [Brevibacterium]MBD8021630.1 acetyl-CoA C-acetyltransferase [Brevibacterium gallinarum]MCT1872592.1 acetyl-CoA C-acetyltransferase [Brevibacterium luteolum]MCT1890565.1 acetyl-CoA C-acetyltransferase [Brevibacterium luteolum]MCT1893055.1 acetyl-CoA C-acetyltransferase [Brevibacterium luteolum]MCT1923847.1 acetyl-CoA C-acetyltransferase [Brevibacterium luteolum]